MKKVNFLNRHLIESKETYLEHLIFSFTAALWLLLAGIILAIHSLMPFTFVASTTKHVNKINKVMQKRMSVLLKSREEGVVDKYENS